MKKWTIWLFFGICLCIFLAPISGFAVETSQRISDREIIESLTRLEEGIKANKEMIVALREEMGSLRKELRAEMGSLRKELRAEMGTLRNEILGFLKWGFGLLFTGMFILVGFILWDRRSTLKPVKDEIDDLERRKVDRIIAAMKKLSEEDSQIAQALRSVGLL
jgi:predicted PurR-regulated permease PerM